MNAELLPVKKIAEVKEEKGVPWLIEGLWAQQGVGFVAGNPKSCKTWLALDIAFSVATKTPAVGRFEVRESGDVLLFAAEDAPTMVRARLAGIARQRGLSLHGVPIHLVLARSLRLEAKEDQARLEATVARYRPKLLVLDPFVRLSAIDENSSLEVSAVLAYLRELQREYELAILVVHHARKSGATAGAKGLSLRGSGDFWAWSDSNLYLSRRQDVLELTIEHRSAATPEPISLVLECHHPDGPYLASSCAATVEPAIRPIAQRIIDALEAAGGARKLEELRVDLSIRMQSLVDGLRQLESDHRVQHRLGGWQLLDRGLDAISDKNETGETEVGSAEGQPTEG